MLSKRIPKMLSAACAAFMLGGAASVASALEAISFNIYNVANANSVLAPTALAGAPAARAGNWNPFFGAPATVAVDSNGRTVPISLSVALGTNGGYGGSHATDGDLRMISTYIDQQNGTASTFTLSSIPYSSYDIYVYCRNDESAANANDRGGSVTVAGSTKYIRTGTATIISASDGSGYIEATGTVNAGNATTLGNYVRFTGLSGSSTTISTVALNYGTGTQRLKVAGFQIVNTGADLGAPTAAPAAPSITEAVNGDGSVIVVWGKATDATSYSVRRATALAGPYTEIASVNSLTTKYADSGLTNGTTYFYIIAAVNGVAATESVAVSAVPDSGTGLRSVGVQFRSGGTAIAAATLAGAPGVRQSNWNSFTGNTLDAMSTLKDNSGTNVAGLSFTHVDGNNNWVNGGSATTNDVALYSGYQDKFDGTNATLTVSGIPYARYDVYFYVRDDTVDRAGSVTLGGTTYYVSGIYGAGAGNPISDGTGYLRSTDTEALLNSGSTTVYDYTSIAKGNYVKFTSVTGGSFTATYTAVATSATARRLKVCGFQIVDTTPADSAPATPSGLTALGGNAQVSVSWNPVSSATSYTVRRSSSYAGTYTDLATIAGTSYTDITAANGSLYYYTVVANNTAGSSAAAAGVSAAPLAYTPVGIGFDLRGSTAPVLAVADVAGAPGARLPNWNAVVVPSTAGGSVTPSLLVDSSGASVAGTTVTYTNGSSASAPFLAASSNDGQLYGTYVDIYGPTPTNDAAATPATLSITGVPYATYDAYFYIHNDGATRAAAITVNGTTYYIRGGIADPSTNGAGYVGDYSLDAGPTPDATAIPPVVSTIAQGNFVRVTGLSGDLTATLAAHYAGDPFSRLKLAGFQIVNASAPTAPTSVPAAPSGVTVTGGVTVNTITWSAVSGATSYIIQRADSAGGPFTTIATVSAFSSSYTDTGLADNVTYFYEVLAANSVGSSAPSSVLSGTTVLSPATGLVATPGNTQVSLSWTGTASATAYEVRYRDAAGSFPGAATLTVTGTTATVTGLTNGTAYYFVVRATAGALSSADTSAALAVPFDPAVQRSIGLNFSDAANNLAATIASGAPSYRQGNWNTYRVQAPNVVDVLGPVAGSYVDNTGVAVSGITTEFTSNVGGTGFRANIPANADRIYNTVFDQTDAAASNIIVYGVPYAKYDVLVYVYDDTSVRGGTITVNDTVTTTTYYIRGLSSSEGLGNPLDTGAGYVLADQTAVPPEGLTAIAQGNYVHIVGLTSPNVQLEFAAVNAGSATRRIKICAVQLVNTSDATALPAAATGVSATAGNAQVGLSWTAASGVSTYNVRRATTAGGPYLTIASGLSSTSYTDTSVTNGTAYYYVVTSVGTTAGTDSAEVSATPQVPAPAAPTSLVAVAGDTVIDLSWTASASATGYTVRQSTTAGGPYTDAGTTTGTSLQVTGLTNGTTYYFVVVASNAGGNSAASNEASAIPVPPAPAAPTGLTATAGDNLVDLSWTASAGATSYTIRISTTAGGPYTVLSAGAITGTTYQATGLLAGTTYYFVVAAANAGGTSADSNEASATPTTANLLAAWRLSIFGSADNSGNGADDADPDADGLPNLIEYATGTNPLVANKSPIVVDSVAGALRLSYPRIADPALIYTVTTKADVATGTWAAAAVAGNPSTGAANVAGTVQIVDPIAVSAGSRRFIRLEVTY